MLRTVIAGSLIVASVSCAFAMPASAPASQTAMPVVKAAVIVKKVVRRPPARRVVVRKTIIRR